ncbi:Hypothetical predicted protein [Mytilus galloprovincialis]|uniref:Uncharacterized protein n=1 Tax=Mytilus galloprovincialis TaxID=29158 RepID=A0A8B6C2N3_MYTGA|nr:Hypothetical predicted protein [Mytilus galloprovincialis]
MDNIVIHERGVCKLLKGLRPLKATGPDEVPANILKQAAESLAPYLTGCSSFSLDEDIDRVQRKAARFVYNQYTDTSPGCVTGLLDQLQWDPLQYRRIKQRLVLCYKIQNQLVEIQPAIYYTSGDNRTRGGHRLRQIRATKEVYNNSFFPRSIRDWNLLPDTVAAAPTLEEFRARLASVPWTQMQPN